MTGGDIGWTKVVETHTKGSPGGDYTRYPTGTFTQIPSNGMPLRNVGTSSEPIFIEPILTICGKIPVKGGAWT